MNMSKKNNLYRVGALAKKLGKTTRTLRFYEQLGLLIPQKRSESGYRLYGEEALTQVQWIEQLQDMGFSIEKRDRAQLRFVVRYDDPSKLADKSWFQALAFWKDDVSAPAEDIFVVLTPTGAKTHINILDANDQQTKLGDQVLRLLEASLKAKE